MLQAKQLPLRLEKTKSLNRIYDTRTESELKVSMKSALGFWEPLRMVLLDKSAELCV